MHDVHTVPRIDKLLRGIRSRGERAAYCVVIDASLTHAPKKEAPRRSIKVRLSPLREKWTKIGEVRYRRAQSSRVVSRSESTETVTESLRFPAVETRAILVTEINVETKRRRLDVVDPRTKMLRKS